MTELTIKMPKSRACYVYRLEVDYPADPKPDDFHWPKLRDYLSLTGARARARLFEEHGAKVRIWRSQPVTFGSLASQW
jgi:hypothetical protein